MVDIRCNTSFAPNILFTFNEVNIVPKISMPNPKLGACDDANPVPKKTTLSPIFLLLRLFDKHVLIKFFICDISSVFFIFNSFLVTDLPYILYLRCEFSLLSKVIA